MFWVGLNRKKWKRGHTTTKPPPHAEPMHVLHPSVAGLEEIRCVAELDSPPQQKWTRPVTAGSASAVAEMEWNEELFL